MFAFGSSNADFETIKINPALNPEKPKAVITGPTKVGLCDSVRIDGSRSSAADGSALTYTWTVLSGTNVNELNAEIQKQNPDKKTSLIVFPRTLKNGFTYKIQLVVTTRHNIASLPTTFTFSKTNVIYATASIIGEDTIVHKRNRVLNLQGTYIRTSCFYENKNVATSWKQTCGPKLLKEPTLSNSGNFLKFSEFSFPSVESTYCFEYTTIPSANLNAVSKATVNVQVKLESLVATIAGGSLRTIGSKQDLEIDASGSYDPDNLPGSLTYQWSCTMSDGSPCSLNDTIYEIPSQNKVNLTQGTFPVGEYTFELELTKGQRITRVSQKIIIVDGVIPVVSIKSMVTRVNPSEYILIEGIVNNFANKKFQWSLEGQDTPIQDLSINDPNQLVLGIDSSLLVDGIDYVFKLSCTNIQNNQTGFAQISLSLNDLPSGGNFIVDVIGKKQTTGLPYQYISTLRFSATNWNDEDKPLSYGWGFVDPSTQLVEILADPSPQNILYDAQLSVSGDVTIVLFVEDALGARVELTRKITVLPISKYINDSSHQLVVEIVSDGQVCKSPSNGSLLDYASCILDSAFNEASPDYIVSLILNDRRSYLLRVAYLLIDEIAQNRTSQYQKEVLLANRIFEKVNQTSYRNPLVNLPYTPEALELEVTLVRLLIDSNRLSKKESAIAFLKASIAYNPSLMSGIRSATKFLYSLSSVNPTKNGSSVELLEMTQTLVGAVAKKQISGQKTTQITSKNINLAVKRDIPSNLVGQQIVSGSSSIQIPEGFVNSEYNYGLDASVARFKNNPYIDFSNTTTNDDRVLSRSLFSSVTDVRFNDPDGKLIELKNLQTPLRIYIEKGNSTIDSERPSRFACNFFNVTTQTWDNSGCVFVSDSATQIVCDCTHTTTFASFLEYVTPELNLLTIDDFKLITQLNQDNFLTLIVLAVFLIIYFGIISGISLFELLYYQKREPKRKYITVNHESQYQPKGFVRTNIERFKLAHIWISALFPAKSELHFTRIQRLTVCYVALLGIMTTNALTFGTNQANETQYIAATIISDALIFPIMMVFMLLFVKTKYMKMPKLKVIKKDYKNSTKIDFEWSHLPFTPTAEEAHHFQEEDQLTEHEKMVMAEMKRKMEQKQAMMNNFFGNEETSSEVQTTKDVELESVGEDDEEEEKEEVKGNPKHFAFLNKMASRRELIYDRVDSWVDKGTTRYQKLINSKLFYPFVISMVILGSLIYFIAIAVIVTLMYTQTTWLGLRGLIIFVTGGVVFYIGGIEAFYLVIKTNRFKLYQFPWRSKTSLFASFAICLTAILLFTGLLIGLIYCTISNITNVGVIPFVIDYWIIIDIGIFFIIILNVIWLIMQFVQPKPYAESRRKVELKNRRRIIKTSFFRRQVFPFYCTYIFYVGAFAYIIIMSYVLIIYGIKFDSQSSDGTPQSQSWLTSCFLSWLQSVFISKPFIFIAKLAFFAALTAIFDSILGVFKLELLDLEGAAFHDVDIDVYDVNAPGSSKGDYTTHIEQFDGELDESPQETPTMVLPFKEIEPPKKTDSQQTINLSPLTMPNK